MGIDQIPNFMTDSEKRTCVRFQMQDSTLLKSLISFLKIVFLCAAHKNIIATFSEKKLDFIFHTASLRFQVQRFNVSISLKNFISIVKIVFLCTGKKLNPIPILILLLFTSMY